MPAVIFQKNAPLYWKKRDAGEEHRESGGEGRPCVVTVLVAEHHVVHATHKREVEHLHRCAVSQDPVPVVLVVDGPETSGIGHQVVGDQPARAVATRSASISQNRL